MSKAFGVIIAFFLYPLVSILLNLLLAVPTFFIGVNNLYKNHHFVIASLLIPPLIVCYPIYVGWYLFTHCCKAIKAGVEIGFKEGLPKVFESLIEPKVLTVISFTFKRIYRALFPKTDDEPTTENQEPIAVPDLQNPPSDQEEIHLIESETLSEIQQVIFTDDLQTASSNHEEISIHFGNIFGRTRDNLPLILANTSTSSNMTHDITGRSPG